MNHLAMVVGGKAVPGVTLLVVERGERGEREEREEIVEVPVVIAVIDPIVVEPAAMPT